jgi:molybdopterin/thiamine biosynthesis adenylyltransferase
MMVMAVLVISQLLCEASEGLFTEAFFSSLDIVVCAAATDAERGYLDERCVFHQRTLIQAGMEGTKGSVQVGRALYNHMRMWRKSRDCGGGLIQLIRSGATV